MEKNPFIKTITKKRITAGSKTLYGGAVLKISNTEVGSLRLEMQQAEEPTLPEKKWVCLGGRSLKELASILTEISEVMEENK